MKRLAIIGAGISGLAAGRELMHEYEVDIFDKSRGVSGRMATRYADQYQFDHGAQFFTARDPSFKQLISKAETDGVVAKWHTAIHHLSAAGLNSHGNADGWYVAQPTMTALCKYLATKQRLLLTNQIDTAVYENGRWFLTDSSGVRHGPYHAILSAIPHKQFMDLFCEHLAADESLDQVRMSGCFSLMIGASDQLMPDFTIARVTGSAIGLMVNNSRKPDRNCADSLLIHSTNEWADQHIEMDLQWISEELVRNAEQLIGINYSDAEYLNVHRWRYAQVEKSYGKPFYRHASLPLYACGDWCIGPRIECAFLSGARLGKAIHHEV